MKDFQLLKQKIVNSFKNSSRILAKFFGKKQHHVHTICYLFLLLLISIGILNLELKYKLLQNKILEYPFEFSRSSAYPIYNYLQNDLSLTNISANAFVVMDDQSKVILFKKNPNLRFSMASTTKIMTAITALEYYKINDVLTIKTEKIEGVNVGFKKGEKVKFIDLLYAMLLPSGNDAALAIAQNYPLGVSAFVEKMNENAVKFKLLNTHFADSTGLDDFGNYTTVLDLAKLSSIAIKNDIFAKIVSTKYKTINDIDNKNTYFLENLNKLLGIKGVNGVKTGFTEDAWGALVTSKIEDGKTLIIVVMKSKDRFADTEKLISLISGKIKYLNFNP